MMPDRGDCRTRTTLWLPLAQSWEWWFAIFHALADAMIPPCAWEVKGLKAETVALLVEACPIRVAEACVALAAHGFKRRPEVARYGFMV